MPWSCPFLYVKGVRRESNSSPRPSQGRMQDHYTTNTIFSYLSISGRRPTLRVGARSRTRKAMQLLNRLPTGSRRQIGLPFLFVSSPTRIRTWNAWLEARNDHPFHHQAISGRQGNRTLITQLVNLLSRQTQRTSIWLPSVFVFSGVTENRTRRVSEDRAAMP